MIYEFPKIETIDDLLPVIKDKEEFVVAEREGYTIINYTHVTPNTFPPLSGPNDRTNALLRECRGIAFYPDGTIMSRPYHKFFNMGERPETTQTEVINEMIFFYSDVLEKLDGSMIRPIYVGDEIHLGTKMGLTDTAAEANKFLNKHPNYMDLLEYARMIGITPIFEWCSRKNKIVLDYPEDRLVLTAARHIVNGTYVVQPIVTQTARKFNIDCVGTNGNSTKYGIKELAEEIKESKDIEGYVLRFGEGASNGHMVKIKCDWYLALHKTKDAVRQEKDVLALILDDQVDDLLPLLSDEDKTKVLVFQDLVWTAINNVARHYNNNVMAAQRLNVTPKQFALEWIPLIGKEASIAFRMFRNGDSARDAVVDYCKKQCNNRKKVDNMRKLLGDHVRYEEVVE